METVSEEVKESKNEEANEEVVNEVNDEAPEEASKQEDATQSPRVLRNASPEARELHDVPKIEEEQQEAKPKAKPKKMARSVKVIELVNCPDCDKKMLPKTLRHSHPKNCKGQPTETRPVAKQQNSYGSKLKEQLRKEIEEEMKTKYKTKNEVVNHNEVVNYSEPIEVKTKASAPQKPIRMVHYHLNNYQQQNFYNSITMKLRKLDKRKRWKKLIGSRAICFEWILILFLSK